MRRSLIQSVLFFAIAALGAPVLMHGQVSQAANQKAPAFDVASIKPSPSDDQPSASYVEPGGRYTAKKVTLRTLIKVAYGVHDTQIQSGPGWADTDRWDVTAKAEGYSNPGAFRDQARLMIRPLLADRFHLSIHHEQRELPVYALVVAKASGELGPQFRRNDEHDCANPVPPVAPAAGAKEPAVELSCGVDTFRPGHLAARAMTISQLLVALTRFNIDRVVVDRTGLTGKFDWDIQWTPQELNVSSVTPQDGPSVFDAFREQAGLKLEPRKERVDVLVIDHVEKPTPN